MGTGVPFRLGPAYHGGYCPYCYAVAGWKVTHRGRQGVGVSSGAAWHGAEFDPLKETVMQPSIDSRIRRLASRRGYRLTSHRGRYFLVDPSTSAVVAGHPLGWTAEEIAEHLAAS